MNKTVLRETTTSVLTYWMTVVVFVVWTVIVAVLLFVIPNRELTNHTMHSGLEDLLMSTQFVGLLLVLLAAVEVNFELLNKEVLSFFLSRPLGRGSFLTSVFVSSLFAAICYVSYTSLTAFILTWVKESSLPIQLLSSAASQVCFLALGVSLHLLLTISFGNRLFSNFFSVLAVILSTYTLSPVQVHNSLKLGTAGVFSAASLSISLLLLSIKLLKKKDIT